MTYRFIRQRLDENAPDVDWRILLGLERWSLVSTRVRMQVLQIDVGVGGSELQIDLGEPRIAIVGPCIDLRPHGLLIGNATVEALAIQDAEFDCRNIELAAMPGCAVNLELFRSARGQAWTGEYVSESEPGC